MSVGEVMENEGRGIINVFLLTRRSHGKMRGQRKWGKWWEMRGGNVGEVMGTELGQVMGTEQEELTGKCGGRESEGELGRK